LGRFILCETSNARFWNVRWRWLLKNTLKIHTPSIYYVLELNWIGIRDVRTVQEEFQQNKQPAARSHFWHLSGFTNYDKMKKKS
jgi:hypothetical protein